MSEMLAYANEIIPRVFLGSLEAAENKAFLLENRITHVIGCMLERFHYDNRLASVHYRLTFLDDTPSTDLAPHLERVYKWLEETLNENSYNRVLIHCRMGVSRSPAILCCYLMKKNRLSYIEAMNLIKLKRPIVDINAGFERQLQILEVPSFSSERT